VFACKWNTTGTRLLTGSGDRTCILWDADTGERIRTYTFHRESILDVDWRDGVVFATSSVDGRVIVASCEAEGIVSEFHEQFSDVNCIRWDPTGELLASGCDDGTVKLWRVDHQRSVSTLQPGREIYVMRWRPLLASSPVKRMLATYDPLLCVDFV
jgi:transducin (beta)-like 1